MKNEDRRVVESIINYCRDVKNLMLEYNSDYEEYENRISFQYSCNMCIIQIGELVGRLSEEFTSAHSEIPWYAIKAMRNLHAHDYENVDFEIVWETLTKEIPDLKDKLEKML
ncbi:MAG: DUF86 domain-containing protein [Lachnospiraceae bacterium]|nr:DUF86 domain-containing protein [Lachnospiraceae bacterium]